MSTGGRIVRRLSAEEGDSMEEESSIVLTREGKYWRAKDTLSDLSTLGGSETKAYQLLAEVLALVLDGMTEELRGLGGGE